MNEQRASCGKSLRDRLDTAKPERFLWDVTTAIGLADLSTASSFGGRLSELAGKSVLIRTDQQPAAALAIVELDGVARRMVLCPPDLSSEHLSCVIRTAGVEAVVSDRDVPEAATAEVALHVRVGELDTPYQPPSTIPTDTEWVLFTSGTADVPKMLRHDLASLTAPIQSGHLNSDDVVWGTFYDIRRYGGLQIFLRGLLGHGSFVFSNADEAVGDHLFRLGTLGVTHLTGTPSHWRRALMSASTSAISPRYIRLSGEIADQPVLSALRAVFPQATVGHAFASTEAGVAFEVNDGFEGFPSDFLGKHGDVELRVKDGSLQIRSTRSAHGYLGSETIPFEDSDGFVETGDSVELRGDRYYFLGRRNGVINVGGLKVHPEEVETLINRHPAVRMSKVRSRHNPITGALVVADIVLKTGVADAEVRNAIHDFCRKSLPRHKVPAALHFVPALHVASTGKMSRHGA